MKFIRCHVPLKSQRREKAFHKLIFGNESEPKEARIAQTNDMCTLLCGYLFEAMGRVINKK